jgi:hypothetical protein
MKFCGRMAVVVLAGLLAAVGAQARGGSGSGSGGGHAGGGHGGFSHSGHMGGSAGRGVGHGFGHSFGRIFGRHPRTPGHQVAFNRRRRFGHRHGFGFGGCSGFGFPRNEFFFSDFNCFDGGFFFNPFFLGGYYSPFWDGPEFATPNDQPPGNAPYDYDGDPNGGDRPTPRPDADVISRWGGSTLGSINPSDTPSNTVKKEKPVTLLQLRDGSMYGLVDYWLEGGELHYTTTYGGQDSLGLERIDLEKTVKLNADRGVEFVMRPKATGQ